MSDHHSLSMSKVNLALICSYSFRPDVIETPRPPGIEARIGTAAHALVEEWFYRKPPSELTDELSPARPIADQMIAWLEPRRSRIMLCEIGLRYDAERDQTLAGPRRGEPRYGEVDDMIIPGTLDLAIEGLDHIVDILDIKTGQKKHVHQDQVEVQGLALARRLDLPKVRVGYIYPRKTKCDEPELATLDEDKLNARAGQMFDLMRKLPMAEPNKGDHCWRCNAKPTCPAWDGQREGNYGDLDTSGFFT